MKPEIKKQIILHLPYLAFIYLFGKVGQAFRLAQGADISAKLLHIGQGFSAAFASAAPSFHPTDLLIGLAAAVIIRLVVYSKQKNAKKYRKGMEYGTARWGTAVLLPVQNGQYGKGRVQRPLTEGLPIGTYNIIYADPPWRYEQRKVQGAAENHYPTMSIDELCALPVLELAAKDCALFLWATFPQLPEALRLIRAWGFRYKTVAFVWLKRNRKSPSWFYGMGYWTRSNAEICLLATKGKPKRQSAGVHQFIISPIEQHSKKPDEARDKILALMGDLPRVELFARQKTPGWDAWGNEIASDITLAERS